MKKEAEKSPKKKKKYRRPSIESERIFSTIATACTLPGAKGLGQGGCVPARQQS